MKNKRGFLLGEETLKIVVALICIIFLIYLLTSIYFSKINETKKIEAKNTLEKIYEIITNSELSGSQEYYILNPSRWYLFSFTNKKPNACANENCICICDKVTNIPLMDNVKRQLTKCDEKGACQIVSNLNRFDEIKIKTGIGILIQKENGVSIILK